MNVYAGDGEPNVAAKPFHISIAPGWNRDTKRCSTDPPTRTINEYHGNDIGIAFLKEPLIFNETINAIDLPEENEIITNPNGCMVAGWGTFMKESGPNDSTYNL